MLTVEQARQVADEALAANHEVDVVVHPGVEPVVRAVRYLPSHDGMDVSLPLLEAELGVGGIA